jgi:argininosuccinate lyase
MNTHTHTHTQQVVENEGSGKLWGGRFEKDTDPDAVNWAESLTCDEEMVTEDLWGSMAHVTMLGRQGVIEPAKAGKLMNALLSLQNQNMAGELDFFEKEFKNHDDVHMNMEARLIKMTGMDIGGRMHTTRSRNDQVPVSSQLRTRNLLLQLRSNVVDAANAFLDRAEEPGALEQVMPGYTHFQHAQPISVAFWISHYAAALSRDLSRLSHAYNSVDANPLGGGAISGTSFPIDRHLTTRLLGFQKVRRHALDATGHRDWMCEVLNSNATLSTTFSRLAEELIMWSSYEFRTVTLDDGFAMGSSMMPQKKNPGTIELLRGRHGILSGYAAAGLSMLHGLPSGYNRDFHEEKELLFASTNMAIRASQIVAPVVSSTQFNLERMEELCDKNFMTATELANWLVKEHDVPFRETHHVVGSLVGAMVKQGKDLTYLDDVVKHLNDTCGLNTSKEEIKPVLTPKDVMLSYNSFGGTGPEATKETVQELREEIQNHADVLSTDMNRVSSAMEATRAICRDVSTDGSCTTGQLQSLIEKYSPA